jgi:hypothetical protein
MGGGGSKNQESLKVEDFLIFLITISSEFNFLTASVEETSSSIFGKDY